MHCWAHASTLPALSAVQSPAPGQPVRMPLWEPKPWAVRVGDGGKKPRRSCVSCGVRRECRDPPDERRPPRTCRCPPNPVVAAAPKSTKLARGHVPHSSRVGKRGKSRLGLWGPPWEFPSLPGSWLSKRLLVYSRESGQTPGTPETPGTSGTPGSTNLVQHQYSCLIVGTHSQRRPENSMEQSWCWGIRETGSPG